MSQLERKGAFDCKVTPEITSAMGALLSQTLPSFIEQKYITNDFISMNLLPRLVTIMQIKDYHQYVIPLLIQLNSIMQIPNHQLFLLFEPIVISETMTKYRSVYPQASKTAPYAAWDKVVLDIGAMAG